MELMRYSPQSSRARSRENCERASAEVVRPRYYTANAEKVDAERMRARPSWRSGNDKQLSNKNENNSYVDR